MQVEVESQIDGNAPIVDLLKIQNADLHSQKRRGEKIISADFVNQKGF